MSVRPCPGDPREREVGGRVDRALRDRADDIADDENVRRGRERRRPSVEDADPLEEDAGWLRPAAPARCAPPAARPAAAAMPAAARGLFGAAAAAAATTASAATKPRREISALARRGEGVEPRIAAGAGARRNKSLIGFADAHHGLLPISGSADRGGVPRL